MIFSSFLHFRIDPPNVTSIQPRELIVNHTQTASFICETFGTPLPNITWIKMSDGSVLFNSVDVIEITEVVINSFTLVSNLTFLSTTRTDQSEYTCVGSSGITNVIGSAENDTVNLLVQGELLILPFVSYQRNGFATIGLDIGLAYYIIIHSHSTSIALNATGLGLWNVAGLTDNAG